MVPRRFALTVFLILSPLLVSAQADRGIDVTFHEITVKIDPESHSLAGEDRVIVETTGAERALFVIGSSLHVEKLLLDGKKVKFHSADTASLPVQLREEAEGGKGFEVLFPGKGQHIVEITYRGIVFDTLRVPSYSRGSIPEQTRGLISEEGVYLGPQSHWYPRLLGDYSFFTVTAVVPPGLHTVTEGKLVERKRERGQVAEKWEIFYPTRDITLVAGRYVVEEEVVDGVKLMAFFFPSEKDLIPAYMKASKEYVSMYNSLIGPYPFSKFAVVENFFPTGYGLPSYTLLGRRVVKLPFLVRTSLGHEVAHSWWGNGVYPDYSQGNWCEGLTVYFADYRYKQALSDSAARDYRRTLLVDYATYVRPGNDFPLSSFRERTTPASRAIGYGKAAFLFHMLDRKLGPENFYRALRNFYRDYQFREASWSDLEKEFEKAAGIDLSTFFDQWLRRKGAPQVRVEEAKVETTAAGYRLSLRFSQHPVYQLEIPVTVEGDGAKATLEGSLASAETTMVWEVPFRPHVIKIDQDYHVFRRLDPTEIPPTISAVLGDSTTLIVLPGSAGEEKRKVYESLAAELAKTGEAMVKEDVAVTVADLISRSLMILGNRKENLLLRMGTLPRGVQLKDSLLVAGGREYSGRDMSVFYCFRSPFNESKTVCVVAGASAGAVEASAFKIIHYGKYSYVIFSSGKRIAAAMEDPYPNAMVVFLPATGESGKHAKGE